jgi:hypothetical protein
MVSTLLNFATKDHEGPLDELRSKGCSSFATELSPALLERLDDMERELRLRIGLDELTRFREVFDSVQLQIKQLEAQVCTVVKHIKDGIL